MQPAPPAGQYNGATRKQNVACDACRAKKIRCKRMTTAQRCEQCVAKDLDCTSNYIEQLQSKPRRPRRFRSNDERTERRDEERHTAPTSPELPTRQLSSGSNHESEDSVRRRATSGIDAMAMMAWTIPQPHSTIFQRMGGKDGGAAQADLLRFLFSPTPVMHHEWRYSDVSALDQARARTTDLWEETAGSVWDEQATAAHLNLWAAGEMELEAVALELIDSFFSIVDPRLPILDAQSFMARYTSPASDLSEPLPHALLAVVLACGAKFTEHRSFVGDAEETTARDGEGGRSRSRLVQLLVIRAREVMEVNKAFRVATLPNVQALILMEVLAGLSIFQNREYRACYLAQAARHLDRLRDPHFTEVTPHKDEKMRTQLTLYILSVMETALFRLHLHIFDSVSEVAPVLMTSSLMVEEDAWLLAARNGANITKRLCADLWTPRTAAAGIPLSTLRDFVHEYSSWRDVYLSKLGLPVPWPETWDFVTTIKALSTDVWYHSLWLVAERSVRDFGVQEPAEEGVRGMLGFEVAQLQERLKREAIHSAMRIAMLSALATEQGFLRLDPLVLYRPIYDAGMYLARQGREDCMGCVAGLKQYSRAYPQLWELAGEVEAAFLKASVPGLEMNGVML